MRRAPAALAALAATGALAAPPVFWHAQVDNDVSDYLCEKSQAEKKACRFKIGKTILHCPVPREQAAKILAQRRSELLDRFISKTGRPFSAWLVLGDDGKVGFEFPER